MKITAAALTGFFAIGGKAAIGMPLWWASYRLAGIRAKPYLQMSNFGNCLKVNKESI